MGYKFQIQYKLGKTNKVADALSRQDDEKTIAAFSLWQYEGVDKLDQEVKKDPKLAELIQKLVKGEEVPVGYKLCKGCLTYNDKLVIPKISTKKLGLIKEFHSSPLGGHSGYLRTYKRLQEVVYWEGMKRDVQDFVARCEVCQRNKYEALSPAGLLQPLPIPQQIWEDVSMDFIIGLPRSQRYDTILVVVDRLSKYGHFAALSHPYTAKDVAEIFIRDVVKLHGFPKSVVSDRDRVFISQFWKELFKKSGTTLNYSSGYHPQTDGQTEVVNRSLEAYLRGFVGENPKQWYRWLPWAEFWFNTTYNRSAGMSPFKAVYGRDPPSIFKWQGELSAVEEVNLQLKERNAILDNLKEQLERSQSYMKVMADRKRKDIHYDIGDLVYVRVKPYKLRGLAKRVHEKLTPHYYGPYRIIEKIGAVAYKLDLPSTTRIHPVFHVSQLKKALNDDVQPQSIPEMLTEDMEMKAEPELVLKTRKMTDGKLEVLIQWRNLPAAESTWEDYHMLNTQFPDFHLEDKVKLVGEGNDGSGLGSGPGLSAHVFSRKKKTTKNSELAERGKGANIVTDSDI